MVWVETSKTKKAMGIKNIYSKYFTPKPTTFFFASALVVINFFGVPTNIMKISLPLLIAIPFQVFFYMAKKCTVSSAFFKPGTYMTVWKKNKIQSHLKNVSSNQFTVWFTSLEENGFTDFFSFEKAWEKNPVISTLCR